MLTSSNTQTQKECFILAQKKFAALVKVKKYTSMEQKQVIKQALNDFLITEDIYRHPNKNTVNQRKINRKQNFWDIYAQG